MHLLVFDINAPKEVREYYEILSKRVIPQPDGIKSASLRPIVVKHWSELSVVQQAVVSLASDQAFGAIGYFWEDMEK